MKLLEIFKTISTKLINSNIEKMKELDSKEHRIRVCKAHSDFTLKNLLEFNKLIKKELT